MDRKLLKARAHSLHPILQLGGKGLTDAVVAEIDRALTHHELIKIRAAPLSRDERAVALAKHLRAHRRRGRAAHRQDLRSFPRAAY